MTQIDIEELIKKIVQETGMSKGEIEEKMRQKQADLKGLIKEEAALVVVAKELGVDVTPSATHSQAPKSDSIPHFKIKDIRLGMQNITLVGKVTQIFPVKEFTKKKDGSIGRVASFFLQDETGDIRFTLWDDFTRLVEERRISIGDTVRALNVIAIANRDGGPELNLTTRGKLELNPSDIDLSGLIIRPPVKTVKRSPEARKNVEKKIDSENLIAKLKKIIKVSTRIRQNQMQNMLELEDVPFNQLLLEWATEFDFKIDGDYIDFTGCGIDAFMAELDMQFKSWDTKEVTSFGKKKDVQLNLPSGTPKKEETKKKNPLRLSSQLKIPPFIPKNKRQDWEEKVKQKQDEKTRDRKGIEGKTECKTIRKEETDFNIKDKIYEIILTRDEGNGVSFAVIQGDSRLDAATLKVILKALEKETAIAETRPGIYQPL